jgi:hypothetical protein
MVRKLMIVLAMLAIASFAFAQQTPIGQGPTDLNGGLTSTPGGFSGAGPNNQGGPGLGRHDLKDNVNGNQLGCETCHLPHTSPTYGKSFLWAWRNMPTVLTTYITTVNPAGSLVTPTGIGGNSRSMLCFSCHDGTSASSNGVTAAVTFNGAPYPLVNSGVSTTGLQTEHPVDAIFPSTSDYVQPITGAGLFGSTGGVGVDTLPVWTGNTGPLSVECGTCHDVHNDYPANNGTFGGIPFLRVANTNGTYLCRECHNAQ